MDKNRTKRRVDPVRQNILPVIAALIWGSAFVAQSVAAESIGAFTFNAARSAMAFLFLLILCLIRRKWRGKPEGTRRELIRAGICCGAALTVGSWLQQKGLETTSSGKAGFITALYIIIVPVMGVFLRKKTPITVWISIIPATMGLYFLCIQGELRELRIEQGDFLILLCAFAFSVQILTIDYFSSRVDGVELSCAQFLTVLILSCLGAAFAGEVIVIKDLFSCWFPVFYTGIFSSGVAYTLQILAQKDSNPAVVSLLLSLESVFATLCGALFLHERLTGREYMGCILMFVAVVIAQIPDRFLCNILNPRLKNGG